MPVTTSYPGVYVTEAPSGVRTITGVATSIAAFIGRSGRGPTDEPVTINSFGDFERIFGGLSLDSRLGYAVRDFYLNGGSQAIVVRLHHAPYASEEERTEAAAAAAATARTAAEADGGATFAWSRENGSVLFPVLRAVSGGDRTTVELASLGRDRRSGLEVGDLVQLADDASAHRSTATPVLRVEEVDRDDLLVVLSGDSDGTGRRQDLHPVLRRWDHRTDDPATSDLGSLLVREGAGDDGWIELEDGVVVQFPGAADGGPADYRSGDHWLVPARTATGDVLWPKEEVDGEQVARPRLPDGVEHHVAPLAIGLLDDGEWTWARRCRNVFAVLPSAI